MDEGVDRLIAEATNYVQERMAGFDPSHDYSHITRVLALAKQITDRETDPISPHPGTLRGCSDAEDEEEGGEHLISPRGFRQPLVVLGVLLHDVNDGKYCSETERAVVNVCSLLTRWGADEQFASQVDRLCGAVSYSTEKSDPQMIKDVIQDIPELAVVQDADRLDAIGAIGVGRCFAFGGARGRGLWQSIRHFEEKLLRLEGMMKTMTGREIARTRSERIREFMRWWDDENELPARGGHDQVGT